MSNEHIGKTYRQITHRLRINRGPGKPDKVSERPRDKEGRYLDSDAEPTLITFDQYDQVDVPFLLEVGAIVEHRPKPSEKPPEKPKPEKEVP